MYYDNHKIIFRWDLLWRIRMLQWWMAICKCTKTYSISTMVSWKHKHSILALHQVPIALYAADLFLNYNRWITYLSGCFRHIYAPSVMIFSFPEETNISHRSCCCWNCKERCRKDKKWNSWSGLVVWREKWVWSQGKIVCFKFPTLHFLQTTLFLFTPLWDLCINI